jgi:tRNA threonylcarbamoyladenosine biosynthesis protein TsaB
VGSRLLLGIDNSLDFLNIVLSQEETLLEERHIKSDIHPSQILPGHVLSVLASHGYEVGDVSLVVVSLGPGSFTGIRVALAFCKGMVEGRGIPLVGVPTLDVLAAPFAFMGSHYICPLIDAKKGEVFAALYHVSDGRMERLTEYQAIRPKDIAGLVKAPCLCFGSGVALCEEFLAAAGGVVVVKDGFSRVSGEQLIREGLKRADGVPVQAITPIYGRRSEAEIKFNVTVT